MKKWDADLNDENGWDDVEPAIFPDDEIYDATDLPRFKPVRTGLRMTLSTFGPVLSRSTAGGMTV